MWLVTGWFPAVNTLGEAFEGPGPINRASGTFNGFNRQAGGETTTGPEVELSPIVGFFESCIPQHIGYPFYTFIMK